MVLEVMKDMQELLIDSTSGSSWLDGFSDSLDQGFFYVLARKPESIHVVFKVKIAKVL